MSLLGTAPAAYLAPVRNLLSEYSLRLNNSPTPEQIIQTWSLGHQITLNWERYFSFVDQHENSAKPTAYTPEAFLAIQPVKTQHFLYSRYSAALKSQLLSPTDD